MSDYEEPWGEEPPVIEPVRRTISVEDIARGRAGYEPAEPQPRQKGRAERSLLILATVGIVFAAWFVFFVALGVILHLVYETAKIGWAFL